MKRPQRFSGQRPRNPEQGGVLVVVMLVILGLFGLGMAGLWNANSNMQIGASNVQRTQALYVAEAGLARARQALNNMVAAEVQDLLEGMDVPADQQALNDPATGVDANGNPNGLGALFVDPVTNQALVGVPYPPAAFNRAGSPVPIPEIMGRYTVWVRNDTAELRRGLNPTVDTNNAVVVRVQGVANDGRTTAVIEVTLGAPPGAVGGGGGGGLNAPTLCNAGKNACDENSNVVAGIVAN